MFNAKTPRSPRTLRIVVGLEYKRVCTIPKKPLRPLRRRTAVRRYCAFALRFLAPSAAPDSRLALRRLCPLCALQIVEGGADAGNAFFDLVAALEAESEADGVVAVAGFGEAGCAGEEFGAAGAGGGEEGVGADACR